MAFCPSCTPHAAERRNCFISVKSFGSPAMDGTTPPKNCLQRKARESKQPRSKLTNVTDMPEWCMSQSCGMNSRIATNELHVDFPSERGRPSRKTGAMSVVPLPRLALTKPICMRKSCVPTLQQQEACAGFADAFCHRDIAMIEDRMRATQAADLGSESVSIHVMHHNKWRTEHTEPSLQRE